MSISTLEPIRLTERKAALTVGAIRHSPQKDWFSRFMYWLRDRRSQPLFDALQRYGQGQVLDVGGWDFFLTAVKCNIPFSRWTTLEPDTGRGLELNDPRFELVIGDGCAMPFEDNRFDTVLCVQVMEHVFEPIRMMQEIIRVLRPGGHAVIVVPQTSNLHMVPDHYYNFTRYWVEASVRRCGGQIVSLKAMGGAWSTLASKLFYFFMHAFRRGSFSDPVIRRPVGFYLLMPLMILTAVIFFPLCLLLALGDLEEDANNHLVVIRKANLPN